MVSGNTCSLSDLYIIRQSLALPLVRTGNDGRVPFLECQLTCAHATFLWYFRVSALFRLRVGVSDYTWRPIIALYGPGQRPHQKRIIRIYGREGRALIRVFIAPE